MTTTVANYTNNPALSAMPMSGDGTCSDFNNSGLRIWRRSELIHIAFFVDSLNRWLHLKFI